MKFGVKLPNISALPVHQARENILRLAQSADQLGFHSVWVSDHVAVPTSRRSPYPYTADGRSPYGPDEAYWECLTVLASIAAVTQRVRLGTGVLVLPLRHPIYAAKVLATLDCLSNGRVIVGAGVGWLREEMEILGAPTWEHRGSLADECIRAFKELWTQDRPQFEGRWSQFSGFTFLPKPVQQPHPPIWVGGGSEAALRRVVRLGDGWYAGGGSPRWVSGCAEQLRQLCQRYERPFEDLALCGSVDIIVDKGRKGGGEAEKMRREKGVGLALRGNPDQLAVSLGRYREAGLSHLCVQCATADGAPGLEGAVRAMETVAKKVIPQVG
ncbi:MAG: LLM class F420-dependent oxidoreductase [Chloroflexi bacterium]|nr:LLM class F420-dependent oxidoreductase [Chloroflexota bacterium]